MDRLTELERKLANLVRFGRIHSVDMQAARVRVQTGQLVTAWLRWMEPAAGNARQWTPPRIGESVTLLSPGGDTTLAVVLRGWFCDAYPAPANNPDEHVTVYSDGAEIRYNTASSHLQATLPGTATVETGGDVTLDCGGALSATVTNEATLDVGTDLTATVGASATVDALADINATAGGNAAVTAAAASITAATITLSGTVEVIGTITCNGTNISDTHIHDGVMSGPSVTGQPQ